jgi:hypothetical protein
MKIKSARLTLAAAAALGVAPLLVLTPAVAHAYPECMVYNVNTPEFTQCEEAHVTRQLPPTVPNFPQCQGLPAVAAANCGDNILRGGH